MSSLATTNPETLIPNPETFTPNPNPQNPKNIDTPNPQNPEPQNSKTFNPEAQNPEAQNSKTFNPNPQNPEAQNSKTFNPEAQNLKQTLETNSAENPTAATPTFVSIFHKHTDPIVLRGDTCAYPNCPHPKDRVLSHTLPCVTCLGATRYCCEECLIRAKPKHMRTCLKTLHQYRKNVQYGRMRQLNPERGYTDLLKYILQNLDRSILLNNVFFIRLPFDMQVKLKTDHPVKKISWNGLGVFMQQNACLRNTYKAMIKHKVEHSGAAFVYAVAYPPDMMFTTTACMPFEADENFEKNMQVTQFLTPCPCELHDKRTTESENDSNL